MTGFRDVGARPEGPDGVSATVRIVATAPVGVSGFVSVATQLTDDFEVKMP